LSFRQLFFCLMTNFLRCIQRMYFIL
jgi:hypothetical protein